MTRLAPVAAAIAVLALLLLGPLGGAGAPARAMGALPACRYDDILTSPRGYGDWQETLVDTILRVTKTYVPPDLVPVTEAGLTGSKKTIRAIAVDDLRALADAARAAGAPIGVQSSYRSYTEQQAVFDGWVSRLGRTEALTVSARPGHSEHQLGLAIDFRSDPPTPLTLHTDWEDTPAGVWMAAHAWEYGWVMSYPKGKIKLTCYSYEPWHFRYVGRELAAAIHESGLTPREYLWANFTTTVVPPPTAKPSAAPPKNTAAPSALAPTPSPSTPDATLPPPGSLPPLATPSAPPVTAATPGGPAASAPPPPEPADDVGAAIAGQAVVWGAIAISLASLALVWIGLRRRRPGAPGSR
ncbi:MAG TPA: D-alanyl-D-alanine carboxypeptidase family protein [Candidatus Limnocylindrales bacterium]|nr:D-alanyl-D-alanine carboxypeptidase family protein [Candidatus Limnocylindrales bacterium]